MASQPILMLSAKRLQQISQRCKDLVFGYCHSTEREQTARPTPVMLCYIILLFFDTSSCSDKFDQRSSHSDIKISDSNLRIDYHGDVRVDAFLLNTVCHGLHTWTFLARRVGRHTVIGIRQPRWKSSCNAGEQVTIGYMFRCSGNICKIRSNGRRARAACHAKYACRVSSGDEITMSLDMNNRSLSFAILGVQFEKAYSVESAEYRVWISCAPGGKTSFSLLSYKHVL